MVLFDVLILGLPTDTSVRIKKLRRLFERELPTTGRSGVANEQAYYMAAGVQEGDLDLRKLKYEVFANLVSVC